MLVTRHSKRLLLCVALGATAVAQEYRGLIRGRITDPSSAAVAAAKIRVTNVETNTSVDVVSNEAGAYQLPFLLPSEYKVRVEHAGFSTVERGPVRVSTGEEVTLDFALSVGAVAETVDVKASAPLLTTESADLGQVINHHYVDAIRVSLSRNAINLAEMAPGVNGQTGTYTSNAQSTFSVSGGGGTQGGNEVMVDGIPNTVPIGNSRIVFVPSLDSVEEVKVLNTMFDASYGHSNGGAVSISTRSGTNGLHGAIYDFKRWDTLNANNWANNHLGVPRPGVDYNQWGYTIGGPVYLPHVYNGRNRTFFSTSLERDSDSRPLSLQARVPTDLERAGDFSKTLNRNGGALSLYDPLTTVVSAGKATRQPFANAQIPAARQDATGVALLKDMPAPNLSGATQLGKFNWAEGGIYDVKQSDFSARIDHYISQRQRLFGRFSRLTRGQVADTFFPGLFGVPVPDSSNLGSTFRHFHNVGIDDTYTFSPSFVGSLRYGFSRLLNTGANGGLGLNPSLLGLPASLLQHQAISGFPVFNFSDSSVPNVGDEGVPNIGSSSSKETNYVHSLMSTFNLLRGHHSLKFGSDFRLVRWNRNSPGGAAPGTFSFSPVFTQADPFTASSANTTGSALATALLGLPSSGSIGYTSPLSLQNQYLGLFVQEDWKITPRLTINLGLRYELETPFTERYNRISYGFDRGAALPVKAPGLDLRGGLVFAGVDGQPRAGGKTDTNNFGPRFGLAYRLNSATVVRGGYGLFYASPSSNNSFLGQVGAFDAVTPYVGTVDAGATIANTLRNPFPNGFVQPLGSSVGLLAQAGTTLTFSNQNRLAPYNQQWQLSVQRQFPGQVVLEVAYMGMLSLKELENFNLNELPDAYLAQGTAQNNKVPNPFLGVLPSTSTLGQGSTVNQRQLWLQFPQFTTLTANANNTGRAVYHSLQGKAEKRLTHGFSALWSYTYSKLISANTTSIVNERHYRSVSAFDQRQLNKLGFYYDLPFRIGGNGVNRVLRQAVQGWTTSGFLTLATGTPLTITQANGRPIRLRNASLSGPVNQRLGDRRDSSGKIVNPYFDTTAFQPLPNQFTVSPEVPYLDELRAPPTRALNASLFKKFSVREWLKVQVRIESTNLTNTPTFSAPGTNMSSAATFGVISSASNERQTQAALRVEF